ncbi:MAG: hypothetical protein N3B12_02365 [Armatimonadetes bacterium]|nr:hypothetical protein [Armatimonadota bacterium]
MALTILAPSDLIEKIARFAESTTIPVRIVHEGEADLQVVRSKGQLESIGSTLQAGGWIRCTVAREIASRLGIDKKQFGSLLDVLDIKIRDCELGCF